MVSGNHDVFSASEAPSQETGDSPQLEILRAVAKRGHDSSLLVNGYG